MSISGIVRIKKPLNKSGRRKAEKVLTFLTQRDIRRYCENKYPSFINRKRIPHIVIKPSHHTQLSPKPKLYTTTSLLLNYNPGDNQNQAKNGRQIANALFTNSYNLPGGNIFSCASGYKTVLNKRFPQSGKRADRLIHKPSDR